MFSLQPGGRGGGTRVDQSGGSSNPGGPCGAGAGAGAGAVVGGGLASAAAAAGSVRPAWPIGDCTDIAMSGKLGLGLALREYMTHATAPTTRSTKPAHPPPTATIRLTPPSPSGRWSFDDGAADVVGAGDDGAADVVGAGDDGAADGNDVPINSTMTIPGAPEPPANGRPSSVFPLLPLK